MKTVAKNQTEVTLRMNIKMFVGNNLPYELLLTKTKKLTWEMPLKIICRLT